MADKIVIAFAVMVALGIAGYFYHSATTPVFSPADTLYIDTSSDPVQKADTTTMLPPMKYGSSTFFFNVKAQYQLSALIVHTKRYYSGPFGWLAPWDYAACWGKVEEWLPYLNFSQVGRFCTYKYQNPSPVDVEYVQCHMSNNHMIPSTLNIRRALHLTRKGDKVIVTGYLVWVMANLKKYGTTNWNSSLVRTDKGDGACEILYVTKLQINDRVYQ